MKRIPLEGQSFGRLLALVRVGNIGRHTAYLCLCKCGNNATVRAASLRKGDTTSCGCARSERMRRAKTTHGKYGTPAYRSWRAMLARCLDSKHPQFKDYGGRGIGVSAAWLTFSGFLKDMGGRPEEKTLDRYPNPDGNYEPGNCRWATRSEQRANRRKPEKGIRNA
jgi:hypothetical protein